MTVKPMRLSPPDAVSCSAFYPHMVELYPPDALPAYEQIVRRGSFSLFNVDYIPDGTGIAIQRGYPPTGGLVRTGVVQIYEPCAHILQAMRQTSTSALTI